MWGHVRIEALLSARTVFGDRKDVEHLRLEGLDMLSRIKDQLDFVARAVEVMQSSIARAQTIEASPLRIHVDDSLVIICATP